MKNGVLKILALLMLSSAVLSGCALENNHRRGRYGYDKHRRDRDKHGHYDRNDNRNDRYHNY